MLLNTDFHSSSLATLIKNL
jgi:hypothetical protein